MEARDLLENTPTRAELIDFVQRGIISQDEARKYLGYAEEANKKHAQAREAIYTPTYGPPPSQPIGQVTSVSIAPDGKGLSVGMKMNRNFMADGTSVANGDELSDIFEGSRWGDNVFVNDLMCSDADNIQEACTAKLAGTTFDNRQDILEVIFKNYTVSGVIDPFAVQLFNKVSSVGPNGDAIDWSPTMKIKPHIYLTIGRNSIWPTTVEVHVALLDEGIQSEKIRQFISSIEHKDCSLGVLPKNIEEKVAECMQSGLVGNFGVSITEITRASWPKMPGSKETFYIPHLKFDQYKVPPLETELHKFIQDELARPDIDTKKKVFRRKNK